MRGIFIISTLIVAFLVIPLAKLCAQDVTFHVARKQKCKHDKQNDLMAENLKGRVKSTITKTHYVSLNLDKTIKSRYDPAGNLIETITDEPEGDGDTHSVLTRKYDKRGNIESEICIVTDSSFDEGERYVLSTDTSRKVKYLYDTMGVLMLMKSQTVRYGETKNFYKKYNADGNCIEETEEMEKKIYQYDTYGRCVEMLEDYGNSNEKRTIYKYDENCKVIEDYWKTRADSGKTIYKYNDKDSLTETWGYYNDTVSHEVTRYKYDTNGNMTSMKDTTAEGKSLFDFLNQYEYDKRGNWVKQKVYTQGEEANYSSRTITYY